MVSAKPPLTKPLMAAIMTAIDRFTPKESDLPSFAYLADMATVTDADIEEATRLWKPLDSDYDGLIEAEER